MTRLRLSDGLRVGAETIRRATRADPAATPQEWVAGALRAVLDDFERIRPFFLAFAEALPRSARSPELAAQLAGHYDKQRERVAGMLTDAFGDALDPDAARHLATCMIATVDGLVLQSFVAPERMPTSAGLAAAAGKGLGAALATPRPPAGRRRGTV